MEDKLQIALTFSGGGYRAATFHLGTLTYLHSVKAGSTNLLDQVVALSTISGGTITGLRYMLALSRGESVEKVFKDLYTFFIETDLARLGLDNLSVYGKGQTASLIRTMAGIYNDKLFGGAVLGDLMDAPNTMPVVHFSANATDFANALPFRFQLSEKINCQEGTEYEYGLIGNNYIRIPRTVASHIRLSEILACSSCFPSGFEPMVFPNDFSLGDSPEVKEYTAKLKPFGIMDGGIVDNQGIEPILLAEDRMKLDQPGREGKCLDLIIISDVASPYIDPYEPSRSTLPQFLRGLTLNKLSGILNTAEIVSILLALSSWFVPIPFITDIFIVIWLFITLVWLAYAKLKKSVVKLAKDSIIKHSVPSLLNLKLGDLASLLTNRVSSVIMLASSVFMKHIRRLEYSRVYEDEGWKNKRITNTIYKLREQEEWAKRDQQGRLPDYLRPGENIQRNSGIASNVGTTLWFTEEEKEEEIPEILIAAGQYTICWNLLDYIARIKRLKNPDERQKALLACEKQLRADWDKFQEDPLFLVKEWKAFL